MGNPWLRLDAHYSHHPRLVRAGPDATLVWPHVLAALKRSDGVCSDDDLDPAVLVRICGGTVAQWSSGLDALKGAGLLVQGERTIKVGRAPAEVVAGWVTPGWDKYQPDARKAAKYRRPSSEVPGEQSKFPGNNTSSPGSRVPSSRVLSSESRDAREDDEPDFDGWSAEGQMLDAILSWAGVPSLAPSKPRKKLQRLARWLVANGGWDEPNFADKRAWLDDQPHRPGMDKLKHLLHLVNDDGTPKPRKGSPAAIKDEAAALAAAGVSSWDAWWRDPSWRGGQSVWALVRTRLRAGEDLDAVWASSCERFQAPHAVAWIQQARERATREELL